MNYLKNSTEIRRYSIFLQKILILCISMEIPKCKYSISYLDWRTKLKLIDYDKKNLNEKTSKFFYSSLNISVFWNIGRMNKLLWSKDSSILHWLKLKKSLNWFKEKLVSLRRIYSDSAHFQWTFACKSYRSLNVK